MTVGGEEPPPQKPEMDLNAWIRKGPNQASRPSGPLGSPPPSGMRGGDVVGGNKISGSRRVLLTVALLALLVALLVLLIALLVLWFR